MGQELRRIKKRLEAKKHLDQIASRENTVLAIHYSCESFYDRQDGSTPRITSIAVRNIGSGQTESFSIHKVAEQLHIPLAEIDTEYDSLEKRMLDEFFEYVRAHQGYVWIHWNMRDINYGFSAIEHRYLVLGGIPVKIEEANKFDLARAMVALYGVSYIGHPRFENIVIKNKITTRDFLNGKEEAEAFENKEYVKLHQSTLRKVDIMANILERTIDNTLETNAKWYEIYGINFNVLGEIVKENPFISLILFTIAIIGFILQITG